LTAPENKYGTFGCSGGALATLSAVIWHGLDSIIDYQFVAGGPPIAWDIKRVCQGLASLSEGICENDPAKVCRSDKECRDHKRCAFPGTSKGADAKRLVDYIARTRNVCSSGGTHALFDASSFRTTLQRGDWVFDHPVDFDISTQGTRTLLRRLTGLGDTQLGVTYTAGQTYNHITSSAPKTWSVHYGAVHCEGVRNPKFLPEVRDRILRGFGLSP
jgi:hypothetical protein